jgi:hypothetical protein
MISWLLQVVTSRDFWISLSVAVIFFLGGKFSSLLLRAFKFLLQKRHQITITGFWVGNCVLPSYQDKYCVEIWRFVQRGENVDLLMFAYSPIDGTIDRCVGAGVMRGAFLSAMYYSCKPDNTESGVLVLRTRGKRLTGSYAQYDPGDPDERFFASDGSYSISRVELPISNAIQMLCGFPPFKTFAEVDAIYKCSQQGKHLSERPT